MTRKKIIQSLAIASLIFSGVSIKAETTATERGVRALNYGVVGHLAAQTITSELIDYLFPGSNRTGNIRFVSNASAAVGTLIGSFVGFKLSNHYGERGGAIIGGVLGGTVMDIILEKGAKQKKNPISLLPGMTKEEERKRKERKGRRRNTRLAGQRERERRERIAKQKHEREEREQRMQQQEE